jgi:hypothetical protein
MNVGITPIANVGGLTIGSHPVVFKLVNYKDAQITANVIANQQTPVTVTMTLATPIITGLNPSGQITSETYANIVWTTDVATINNQYRIKESDIISYGNFINCGLASNTLHQCSVSGLQPGYTYNLNVKSCITADPQSCTDATTTFTTAAPAGCSCPSNQCIYDKKPGPLCICGCAPSGDSKCTASDNDCV